MRRRVVEVGKRIHAVLVALVDLVVAGNSNWGLSVLHLATLGNDGDGEPVADDGNVVALLVGQEADDGVEFGG